MALELELFQSPIIKRAEPCREPAQRPDKPELRGDPTDNKAEPQFLRKLQAAFGLPLGLVERIARQQEIGVQLTAGVGSKRVIAGTVRYFYPAPQQVTSCPDMPRPGGDEPKRLNRSRLETVEFRLFSEFIAEAGKSKAGVVLTESWPGRHGEELIRHTRGLAVAVLETEADGPAAGEGKTTAPP